MNETTTNTRRPNQSHKPQRRKPVLRPLYHLMEPDELTPEERLDRIVDILAEAVISEDRAEDVA